ncbi:ABC transporter family protein (macronuclear) [Tetrahymena thermophila SB210]|uniref:ABC transporter family protein n=1 Tax=Tetrahymena thermophila (strain SB210) TaxID=312017 RepID=Q22BT5_TETTS|nr:ABC transporter family protein [Tetrahymena thermophila SB210]EAR82765.1 ABC transporter family protein [Tetrahymena thermophila SB210]|eukprot:XP_001030428.1 ABC transporter family protein [Tetrahymena thermophila SB210]
MFKLGRQIFCSAERNAFLAKKIIASFSEKTAEEAAKKKVDQKNKDFQTVYRIIHPEKKGFILAAVTSAISSGIFMLYPKLIPQLSDLYANKYEKIEESDSDEQKLNKQKNNQNTNNAYLKFFLTWGLVCGVSGFFNFSRRYINGDLGNRISIRLRQAIYNDLMTKDSTFYFNKSVNTAKIIHKLSNDVSQVSQSVSMDLFIAFRGALFITGGTGFLLFQSPQLILPSLFVMAGLSVSSRFFGNYQRHYKKEEAYDLTKTSEQAQEALQNIKLIKISNTEIKEQIDYQSTLARFYNSSKKVQYWTGMNFGFLEGFGLYSLIGILGYGSFLISSGLATPELLSSSMYAFYVGLGVRSIVNTYTELKKTTGLYDGIVSVIGTDVTQSQTYNNPKLIEEGQEYLKLQRNNAEFYQQLYSNNTATLHQSKPPHITLKNITFKYDEYGTERQLLSDLNIEIESGSVVALVGPSGCGKTTVLNLLTKLYQPTSGDILFDGQSLQAKDSKWVQQNVSYVTQEPMIFQDTVYYNIIYGNQGFDTSQEKVIEAAKMANAHDFIMSLPEGYQTKLSERGQDLSGGQRQRLILARAILKDPKILILDEGTANLDSESEKAIIQDLKTISKNRTCIIVTHKIENFLGFVNKIIELKAPINSENKLQQEKSEDEKAN